MNAIRMSRPALVTIAVLASVIAVVVSTIVVTNDNKSVKVVAFFADASPLVPGNVVKASGVDVGEITQITVEHGQARLEMSLDHSILPIHQDARAVIQPVSLLGERHIELQPGSPATPPLDGEKVIPAERTERSVDLGDMLNAVDDHTGTALAAMVTGLGEGARGRGPEIANAIKALKPALGRTRALGQILNDQNGLLTQLVDHVQPVAGALAAGRGQQLDQLVGSADRSLGAIAARRDDLKAAMRELPTTLTTAQRTLGQLAGVANSGTTTLKSLRPVTDDLKTISSEVHELADSMEPALASAKPVLERGNALLDEAAPLTRALRPAGPYLRGVADSARPLVEGLDSHFRDILDFVKFWALSTNGYDGISHYFRGHVVDTPKDLSQIPGIPLPGMQEQPPPPTKPDTTPPSVPEAIGAQVPQLPTTDPGNATGLTPVQENSLVEQLLGGQ